MRLTTFANTISVVSVVKVLGINLFRLGRFAQGLLSAFGPPQLAEPIFAWFLAHSQAFKTDLPLASETKKWSAFCILFLYPFFTGK